VLFEADWPTMGAASEYAHRRRASPWPAGEQRFPQWMWHNQVSAACGVGADSVAAAA